MHDTHSNTHTLTQRELIKLTTRRKVYLLLFNDADWVTLQRYAGVYLRHLGPVGHERYYKAVLNLYRALYCHEQAAS